MVALNQERGVVAVDGFEMPYLAEGTGRNVIVIGDTTYYPRTFSNNLRDNLRLVFLSHRGFGKATRDFTNADFELDVIARDIEAARQQLDLDPVVILGHSGHGHMALHYARKYPDAVTHIAIVAMSPDSSAESFAAADRYLEESVSPERKLAYVESMSHLAGDIAADPDRRFIHYALRSGARIWYDYTFDATPLWQGVTVIPEMFDYVWGTLFPTIDIMAGLGTVTQPVFVGLGRYDYWNPPHLWEPVRDSFHDLRLRVFEKSGHTPQFEEPQHLDRELLGWLADES